MAKVLVYWPCALFLLLCLLVFARSDHGHSHDTYEPSHGHSHDHHGHSHDHHGHSHDHHGHSHDNPGHTHGDSDDDHHFHESASERPASFKYSREANVKHQPETPSVDNLKQAVKPPKPKEEEFNLWLTAVGSTVLISLAPIVILFIIPLDKSPSNENFLKVLLSFASGGLLGDAFLHLIPHALSAEQESSHSHSHSHSTGESHSHNMGVGLWILSGIVAFLAVEKFVRIVKGKHGHSHSHSTPKKEEQHGDNATKKTKEVKEKPSKEKKEVESSDIKVSAYLNLAADFTHNFTDGLAIGASYLVGKNIGIVTTLTILLHEVPHEIGDFAILIQSGCSKKKAMLLQLVTAAGAITGTICSLMAEGAGELATSWILPFTAGGFIYIATVSVIPELLGDSKLTQSLKEIFAMLVGISMMILIAYIE